MKLFKMFKRGQKGFTLVELMVVMAIMAVLAAIVIPPVTGTKQVSGDTQVKQDAGVVQTAVSKYNSESNAALTISADSNFLGGTENTTNKWPDTLLASTYSGELAVNTVLLDKDETNRKNDAGTDISPIQTNGSITPLYRAINWVTLKSSGAMAEQPSSVSLMNGSKHNYLWLLRITTVAGTPTATGAATYTTGRSVEVYSLTTVAAGGTLTYQRIY